MKLVCLKKPTKDRRRGIVWKPDVTKAKHDVATVILGTNRIELIKFGAVIIEWGKQSDEDSDENDHDDDDGNGDNNGMRKDDNEDDGNKS